MLLLCLHQLSCSSVDTSGWPRILQQPPSQVTFYNQTGTVISCSFAGSPQPIVYWTVSSTQPGFGPTSGHSLDHLPLSSSVGNIAHGPSIQPPQSANFHDQSRWPPLSPSTALRYVRPDGALVFTPFSAGEYDDSVHNRRYRCVGVNQHAALLTREVHVKACKFPYIFFYFTLRNDFKIKFHCKFSPSLSLLLYHFNCWFVSSKNHFHF